jgi:hypothetical protein
VDASGPAACGRIALGSCPNKSEIAGGRETEVCCIVDDSKPIIMSLRKEIQAAIGRCIINDIRCAQPSETGGQFLLRLSGIRQR